MGSKTGYRLWVGYDAEVVGSHEKCDARKDANRNDLDSVYATKARILSGEPW